MLKERFQLGKESVFLNLRDGFFFERMKKG